MTGPGMLDVAREALYLLVLLVGPPVGAGVVAGLLVSVVQSATQIQEQTIGFAVRAAAVVASLIVAGPWIGQQLASFTETVLAMIRDVGSA
ncbi:MAG: flagellar biosynthetic protein FliQ [Bradymonadia bacterium]